MPDKTKGKKTSIPKNDSNKKPKNRTKNEIKNETKNETKKKTKSNSDKKINKKSSKIKIESGFSSEKLQRTISSKLFDSTDDKPINAEDIFKDNDLIVIKKGKITEKSKLIRDKNQTTWVDKYRPKTLN